MKLKKNCIIEVRSTKINPNHQSFSQLSVCCTDCNNNGKIRSSLFMKKIYSLNVYMKDKKEAKEKNEKKNDPRGYKSIIIKSEEVATKKLQSKQNHIRVPV